MKKYFLPIVCCFSISAFAQQDLKGIILLDNNTPAAFVDVILWKDEKIIDEISTDEQGLFNTNVEQGTYTIHIEENGIRVLSQEIIVSDNKDLGVILIPKQEKISLNETVVTSQKKIIEKKVDRLVFNPDMAEGAKGGNALDALKLAPRIKVDENTDAISIIGKGSVSVLINDRLTQMNADQLANYLKTIKSEDIEKIEVITNPPAKFDASGNSGVINIVLKNTKSDSFNGSLSSTANIVKKTSFFENGNFNFRKDKWTLTARGYYNNGIWESLNTSSITYPTSKWESANQNKNRYKNYGGSLGADYQLNDKLITGFNLDISQGNGNNPALSRTNIYDLPEKTLNRYITNDNNGTKWDWKYLGLNYHVIKKFAEEGKKLTFDFDYSNNTSDSNNVTHSNEFYADNTSIPNKLEGNSTLSDYKSNRFNFSLDMEHPVNSWKMNYGARLRFAKDESKNKRFTKTTGDFVEDNSYGFTFGYNENIYALYYSVEKQLSEKWSAKVGLRYEHADAKGFSKVENIEYNRKYDGLFPTAYLMYEPAENHSLSINYSRRIERPNMWSLNPALVKDNDYSYNTGNPNLLPSYSQNLEFEYAYKDIAVTSIYYNFTNDIVSQVTNIDPQTEVTTTIPLNIGKSFSIGFSENVNVKPYKWWKINASTDVYYIKTTGEIPSMNFVLDGIMGEFRITNNFDLNKKKTLFANYTYRYNTKGSDSDLDKHNDVVQHNAGLRALFFNKKLQLSFNVNNIFKNHNFTYTSQSNNINSQFTNEALRTFRIGLVYNFGKQFSIEKSKSNQEQSSGGGNG